MIYCSRQGCTAGVANSRPTTVRYRYSWITPLAISKRPPHAIYQGAQVLFRSSDGSMNAFATGL